MSDIFENCRGIINKVYKDMGYSYSPTRDKAQELINIALDARDLEPNLYAGMGDEQLVKTITKRALDEKAEAEKEQAIFDSLNIASREKMVQYVDDHRYDKSMSLHNMARLASGKLTEKGMVLGEFGAMYDYLAMTENKGRAFEDKIMAPLVSFLDDNKKAREYLNDVEGRYDDEIIRLINDPTREVSDPVLGQIRDALVATFEFSESLYNTVLGIDFTKKKGNVRYMFSHSVLHNYETIKNISFNEWKQDFASHFDKTTTLKNLGFKQRRDADGNVTEDFDAVWDEFLRAMYDNIKYGKDQDFSFLPKMGGISEKQRIRAYGGHRLVEFIDVEHFIQYKNKNMANEKRSLMELISRDKSKKAMKLGLIDALGINPSANLDNTIVTLVDEIKAAIRESDDAGDVKTSIALQSRLQQFDKKSWYGRQLEALLYELQGSTRIPGNQFWARNTQRILKLQAMSKLGGAWITSWADMGAMMVELKAQGVPTSNVLQYGLDPTRGVRDYYFSSDEKRKLGFLLGGVMDYSTDIITQRFGDITQDAGKHFNSLTDKIFKLNLLRQHTEGMKQATRRVLSSWLGDNANKTFAELPKELQYWLGKSGIRDLEWDFLRQYSNVLFEGNPMILPFDYKLSDAEQFFSARDIIPENTARWLVEVENKLRHYLIDSTHRAIPTPGAEIRAKMHFGWDANSPQGAAIRLITQFKSFPLLMTKIAGVHLANNYGGDRIFQLSLMFVYMTAIGALSLQVKQLLQGRDTRETNVGFIRDAILQGGSLGLIGDFTMAEVNKATGRGYFEAIAGPTFSQFGEAYTAIQDTLEGRNVSNRFINTAFSLVPGQNIFYLNYALKAGVINNINEWANPGYNARIRASMLQDGRDFYLPQTWW